MGMMESTMKTIIAGSRNFDNYDLLRKVMSGPVNEAGISPTRIVSDMVFGAETLGERYASDMELPIDPFPADWSKHGRSAGYIRNAEMAEYADALVAFWDMQSKGTENMIKQAKKHNLKIFIEIYNVR